LDFSIQPLSDRHRVLEFVRDHGSGSDLLPDASDRIKLGARWYGAVTNGKLLGLAQLEISDEAMVGPFCIHSEWRRRGIAGDLMRRVISEAASAGKAQLVVTAVDRRDEACRLFLESMGFEMKKDGVRMEWSPRPLPEVDLPEGYWIRTYREGDEEEWAECVNRAYATERDPTDYTAEKIREKWVDTPNFMPDGTFFAVKDDEIVGSFMAWREVNEGPKRGRLHWLAVVPEHRRRGLAKALTVKVIGYLLSQGLTSIFLDTGYSLRVAMSMYRKFGFVETPRLFEYVKDIS
jgi:mycothiol synthase